MSSKYHPAQIHNLVQARSAGSSSAYSAKLSCMQINVPSPARHLLQTLANHPTRSEPGMRQLSLQDSMHAG